MTTPHRPYADRYRFLLFCAAVATAVMWLGGCHAANGLGRDIQAWTAPYCEPYPHLGEPRVSRKSPKSLDD